MKSNMGRNILNHFMFQDYQIKTFCKWAASWMRAFHLKNKTNKTMHNIEEAALNIIIQADMP